jgi:hypothetical protein
MVDAAISETDFPVEMKRPRIYSDFNGPFKPGHMLLSYVGTLRDLNLQKIVLSEGLKVTVYSDSDENEDIEMDGVVTFGPVPDSKLRDCWHVRTDPDSVRFVRVKRDDGPFRLPCFRCRSDIYESLGSGSCPVCGLDVEYAR